MFCSFKNPAQRRYVIRMWVAAGFCIVFAFVSATVFRHLHPTGIPAYLVAVLPALPIVGAIVGTGLYLAEETDEFQRNLLVQALLGGIGGTLAVVTVWGYLEDFAKTPRLDLILVYAMFWGFAGISYGVVRQRYR
jgi:hypothetical protein